MKKFMKLSVLMVGVGLLMLASMPLAYGFVTVGPPGSGATYFSLRQAVMFQSDSREIEVWAGTYTETLPIIVTYGGGNNTHIYVRAGDERPLVNGRFVIQANNVTIEGLDVVANYSSKAAFDIQLGSKCSVLDNYISGNYRYAFLLGYRSPTDVLIDGNVIFGGADAGSGRPSILSYTAGVVVISHNTFYQGPRFALRLQYHKPVMTFYNNLLFRDQGDFYLFAFTKAIGDGVTSNWNDYYPSVYMYYGHIARGSNDISVDPVFASQDSATADFLYLSCDTPDVVLSTGSSDGDPIGALGLYEPCIIPVEVDIKPGSDPNSVNCKSKGVLPVAILTTDEFDAATVDAATVELEGVSAVRSSLEDVDDDGDLDLALKFSMQELCPLEEGTLLLTGATLDGIAIEGSDSVRIVPGASKGKK